MIFAVNINIEVEMTEKFIKIACRILFLTSFIIAGVAISEKVANLLGLGMLRGYPPSRLLAFSAVSLLFVVALQLREIKKALYNKESA
jgi:hypothetical protein